VEVIPALRHVPSWSSGTGWQQTAKVYKSATDASHVPFENAKLSNDNNRSFVYETLAEHDEGMAGSNPEDVSAIEMAGLFQYLPFLRLISADLGTDSDTTGVVHTPSGRIMSAE